MTSDSSTDKKPGCTRCTSFAKPCSPWRQSDACAFDTEWVGSWVARFLAYFSVETLTNWNFDIKGFSTLFSWKLFRNHRVSRQQRITSQKSLVVKLDEIRIKSPWFAHKQFGYCRIFWCFSLSRCYTLKLYWTICLVWRRLNAFWHSIGENLPEIFTSEAKVF